MFEESELALSPINFFQISADCNHLPAVEGQFPTLSTSNMRKYVLPDTSALCAEDHFADLAMGWNALGIEVLVHVKEPYRQSSYPDIMRGDSVELFFDTRDVKTSGFNTRFCHHFYILPESVEGHLAGELTRFRTEDAHELCEPSTLQVKSQIKPNSFLVHIFIPAQSLYGYDPEQFDRLGFSYRINRAGGYVQHFSVTSDDFQIEQQPSLWSSIRLVK